MDVIKNGIKTALTESLDDYYVTEMVFRDAEGYEFSFVLTDDIKEAFIKSLEGE